VQREIYASSSFILAVGDSDPEQRRAWSAESQARRTAASSPAQALVNAAKFTAARFTIRRLAMEPGGSRNRLIFKAYLLIDLFRCGLLQEGPANSYMIWYESWRDLPFFDFPSQEMRFASVIWPVSFAGVGPTVTGDGRQQPACHLNLTHCDDTKSSMRRDGSGIRTSI
jgi:hypothetical protein